METKDFKVIYEGCIVDVTATAIKEGLEILASFDRAERRRTMTRTQKNLDSFLSKIQMKLPVTDQEKQDFCDDVGIWFTEQVRTGKHKQYYQGKMQ